MVDVIVVGSGPGGINAAAALLEGGASVTLLDFGNEDRRYANLIPHDTFSVLRHTDTGQHRYLLGDDFEGIPFGSVRVGAQLTPPRMHILADAAERMPVDCDGFEASMSLAKGGFGAGWSAGVFPFSGDELREMSLGVDEMRPYYDAVAERIGVAGDRDDLESFFPSSPSMMPALDVDSSAERVLRRYDRNRASLNASGFFLGKARLAVCTARHRGRGPHGYLDLGYWADMDRSIYRPQWTLDELGAFPHFTYLDRRLATEFTDEGETVRVRAAHADTRSEESHEARALVLAAGTLGSVRIVLRSLDRYDTPVPILCNPYTYVVTLNLGMIGTAARDRRYSLAQLTMMLRVPDGGGRLLQAQMFSYRSLLTFKLMKEAPLAHRESLAILRLLIPKLAVLGIHHEDRPSDRKTCVLRRGRGGQPDRLEIRYRPAAEELDRQRADERTLLRCVRRLGCIPLRRIRPGDGASLHYAGTFPMTATDAPLTCDVDGRLRGTRAVYLADGSIFPWLPPKGLTFNLMANANRVGRLLAARLR